MLIKLGMKVRDEISGFTGTVIGKAEYLTGCVQFCVEAAYLDGKRLTEWFDDGRLGESEPHNGGPMPSPSVVGRHK